MTLLDFLLLSFASFRLARLAIEDTITQPLRDSLFQKWPGTDIEFGEKDRHRVTGGTLSIEGKIFAAEPTWIGDRLSKLLSCYACAGFWTSALLTLAYLLAPTPTRWIALPFALSGIVWLIAVVQDRLDRDS